MTTSEGAVGAKLDLSKLSTRTQWLLLAGAIVLFILAYPTEPLFFKNQVTKYLAGMADAGVGMLHNDWTANTKNGLPAFRGLTFLIYRFGMPQLSYVIQVLLMVVFVTGALGIARVLEGSKTLEDSLRIDSFSIVMLCFLILTNIGLLTKLWWGVAQQFMLGPVLEPALFATLFFAAILLYVTDRRVAAYLTTIPIGLFHPGYIIPVTVLIAGFVVSDWPNLRRTPLSVWASMTLALLILAAHAIYLRLDFLPTSGALSDRANIILTEFRIPEHALVSHWLTQTGTFARLGTAALAIWISRKHKIGLILLTGTVATVALTVLQTLTGSHLMALIAPWRASVWIIPLSVVVVLGWAAHLADRTLQNSKLGITLRLPALIVLVVLSLAAAWSGAVAKLSDYSAPLAGYEAYLKRTADERTQILAPTDLMNLRIDTEAPVYITEKSHPYQDTDVLEWYRRVQVVDALYKPAVVDCAALEKLAREAHLTDMVVTRFDQTVNCPFVELVYLDAEARVFKLDLK